MNNFNQSLVIPADFYLVRQETHERNGQEVTVERYQSSEQVALNNAHVTIITDNEGELVSYNSSAYSEGGLLGARHAAKILAEATFTTLLPNYARRLTFMRIEEQERSYVNQGRRVIIPVYWVKFAHSNGSYNWVTIGPDEQIIEIERESFWDYGHGRRATEMWNDDDWVRAREGNGPQLAAPNALA